MTYRYEPTISAEESERQKVDYGVCGGRQFRITLPDCEYVVAELVNGEWQHRCNARNFHRARAAIEDLVAAGG